MTRTSSLRATRALVCRRSSCSRYVAQAMRTSFVGLFLCGTLCANPIAEKQDTYIASQLVEITLTTTDARFRSSYVFRSTHANTDTSPEETINLEVPIWFPLDSADRSVTRFWQVFSKDAQNIITAKNRRIFDEAFGLTVRSGTAQAQINTFLAYGSSRQQNALAESWRTSRFACLLFSCQIRTPTSASAAPVMIAYRQPYSLVHGERQFFYVPVFENLPANITPAKSRHYSVLVRTESNCVAAINNGERTIHMRENGRAKLRPVHQQAIRGIVGSRSNQAMQRTAR